MWGYVLTTAASALYSIFPMLGLARAVQLVIIGALVHLLAVEGTLRTFDRLIHGWIVLITLSIVRRTPLRRADNAGPDRPVHVALRAQRQRRVDARDLDRDALRALALGRSGADALATRRLRGPDRGPVRRAVGDQDAGFDRRRGACGGPHGLGVVGAADEAAARPRHLRRRRGDGPRLRRADPQLPHARRDRCADRHVQPAHRDLGPGVGLVPRPAAARPGLHVGDGSRSSTRPASAAPTTR